MKIALCFSLMAMSIVMTIALGVNGDGVVLFFGLLAVFSFSFTFMSLFVDFLRDLME